jgi:lipopolysaccharide export system protein LptA
VSKWHPIAILLFLAVLSFNLHGQDNVSKIDLKHAESMNFNEKIANDARRFIGNVFLKQEDILMYCDSVYLYTADNNIKAFNNVKLVKGDSVEVFSDFLFHSGNIKRAQFRNNVILKDKKVTVYTDSLNYDINTNRAYYFNGGKIVDSTAVLTSKTGYYYANEKMFFFKDNVVVDNKDYKVYTDTLKYDINTNTVSFQGPTTIVTDTATLYSEKGWYNTKTGQSLIWQKARYTNSEQIMYADTIFYDQKMEYGQGFSNIKLYSLKDSIIVSSDYAYHDRAKKTTLLTKKALVTQIHGGDSIFLHADTIFVKEDSTIEGVFRTISVYRKAQMFGKTLQMRADSVVFSMRDSVIRLFYNPIIWTDSSQLTADHINLRLVDNDLREIHLLENALIVLQHDSVHYDQIKGQIIIGYLKEKRLQRADVDRRAEVIYYLLDDDKISSMNSSKCRNIGIYFDDGQIDQVVFITSPEGKVLPLKELNPNNMYFRNFGWFDNVRPKSIDDIFIWKEIAKGK